MPLTRRDFITRSTSAAIYLSAANSGLSLPISKDQVVKVGIIGTGDRGTGLAQLIRNIKGMEVAAMCDIIPFRLEEAKKYGTGKTKYVVDYRKVLDDKEIDAVLITTPFSMHADMAIEALDAEKHIYCEKTMAYGYDDIQKLLNAARKADKIFQTGHQYHSSRLYHYVYDLVSKGYLGEISLIECQWNRNGDWRRPVPDPKWERMINWRMYREYSGGLTAELCSHQIDFSNWIIGGHPTKVSGFGGVDYWKDGRETYDNVHLITEYPNGAKATYTSLTTNSKDDYKIQLLGKKGSIVITRDQAWVYLEQKEEAALGVVDGVSGATMKAWNAGQGVPLDIKHEVPTRQALLDFRESIIQNKRPESNAESGAKVSIVVQMALDAMDNGRVEYWKDDYNF